MTYKIKFLKKDTIEEFHTLVNANLQYADLKGADLQGVR